MGLIEKQLDIHRFKQRYGGEKQLAEILEQLLPKKREFFLQQLCKQDSCYHDLVIRKMVLFEDLIYLDEGTLAEILSTIPMKVLAYALKEVNGGGSIRETVLKRLGYRELRQLQDETEKTGPNVSLWLVVGAQRQILKIARQLEKAEKIQLQIENSPRLLPKSRTDPLNKSCKSSAG